MQRAVGGSERQCALRIVFADRKGRRKLANIGELVERCNAWRPPPPHASMTINCSLHNFGVGLVASLPLLATMDVFVVPHGADIINGFAMHAVSLRNCTALPAARGTASAMGDHLWILPQAPKPAGRVAPARDPRVAGCLRGRGDAGAPLRLP
eukprot:1150457-Prymnesium_polylepis.1